MQRDSKLTVLGLFFTRGVGLADWVDAGIYDREIALYRSHLENGTFSKVVFFTYGQRDRIIADQLHAQGELPLQIEVVHAPEWTKRLGRASSLIYSLVLPIVSARSLRKCNVFKTNQMEGALTAVISSLVFNVPLYVRTGYTLTRVVNKTFQKNLIRRYFAYLTEFFAFNVADKTSVSSKYDYLYVIGKYKLENKLPEIIGNFVDTDLFISNKHDRLERIVFVGRLSPEKNLSALIQACAQENIGLDVVGVGDELENLKNIAKRFGADVNWIGVVPNALLPEVLDSYRYFALPSFWEGMPKALIEAMSMSLVCIGNTATGISELVDDGISGFLSSNGTASSLAEAIKRARSCSHPRVGAAARAFVLANFSLPSIVKKEERIFASLLSNKGSGANKVDR
jgi:glycosyltransferase involved in cell wall biosynthesis